MPSYDSTPSGAQFKTRRAPELANSVIRKKLQGYVGFANLPNQVHRKSVKKGFHFTTMVVGESGLGKSTLVNTLFNTTLYPAKNDTVELSPEVPKTVEIQAITADIEENGVKLRLTVVDTPGFGDFVNNEERKHRGLNQIENPDMPCLDPVGNPYSITSRPASMPILNRRTVSTVTRWSITASTHASTLSSRRVTRKSMPLSILWFEVTILASYAHLKPLDIEFMRRLHTRVNLIPVIAKSDTLTEEEIRVFKERILADIAHHNIHIYQAPQYEYDDSETISENREIMAKIPFAIVGSDKEVEAEGGRRVRGRKYPWGVIEVDNEEHCDFHCLIDFPYHSPLSTHMEELKEYTNDVLYENYRTEKLMAMGIQQDPSVFKEVNPLQKMEEERQLHETKLAKMESEMKMVFQAKVQEKEAKLKQSEEELYARHKEMKEALEKQRLELEEKKRRIESGRPITPEKKQKKGFSFNK
ncbi:Septin-domain-containing protein [Jimgerdemannia flammicorona]|uniref:Septin-domain-containing protein n=1 Tax=Jimgerdemannia flammicorona TaxID=994334 RepID=A0A433AGZ2_9FUNG|nr:Septin-domain-containing protein [Jimgerdemannia flammicorona]